VIGNKEESDEPIKDSFWKIGWEREKPGKDTAAVTRMASGTAGFEVGFVIRLNSVSFGAFLTHPLLVIAMLPSEMLLDPDKVAKSMAWVVVQTTRFWAYKNPLPHLLRLPLKQFPRYFVPSPMHLQILVSLEPLVADLTHIAVGFQQGLGRERHDLSFWIYIYIYVYMKTIKKIVMNTKKKKKKRKRDICSYLTWCACWSSFSFVSDPIF
jgi:hypothetical protein